MAAPQRDPGDVTRTLRAWFEQTLAVTDVEIGDVTIPATTGFSNETILFDAAWSKHGSRDTHHLVARIAPSSYQVFLDDTFEMQFQVMRALTDTSVPIAAVHWYEADESWFGQPFWIMARVDGLIPSDNPPYAGSGWLADATPAEQKRAWTSGIEAMAAVHNVALDRVTPATAALGAVDELERYDRFLRWAEDGEPHRLAREALAWLGANRPALPREGRALVWGDARLSNVVFRDFEVVAVLDWEMATIADPLLDLGWWIFADDTLTHGSGCERLPGFAPADETAACWAEHTGRSADALPYFLVFAGLRFTVIMLRMGKLLTEMGFVPAGFAYDNLVSQGLARQLARV